jgi:hypothetical protein
MSFQYPLDYVFPISMYFIFRFFENLKAALEQSNPDQEASTKEQRRNKQPREMHGKEEKTESGGHLDSKCDFDDFEAVNNLFVEQSDIG